mgnify:CR=1 FL=1
MGGGGEEAARVGKPSVAPTSASTRNRSEREEWDTKQDGAHDGQTRLDYFFPPLHEQVDEQEQVEAWSAPIQISAVAKAAEGEHNSLRCRRKACWLKSSGRVGGGQGVRTGSRCGRGKDERVAGTCDRLLSSRSMQCSSHGERFPAIFDSWVPPSDSSGRLIVDRPASKLMSPQRPGYSRWTHSDVRSDPSSVQELQIVMFSYGRRDHTS